MILFRFRNLLLLLFITLHCSFFSKRDVFGKDSSVHLVLNSTGYATEVCLFKVDNTNNSCKAVNLNSYPKCVEYFPENPNSANLDSKETLDQIYKGLADLEISRPSLKQKIQNVGYLATGSFGLAKEAKQVTNEVENYFKSENLKINTKILNGEEVAKLTLTALLLEERKNPAKEIAILQIGTESVEVIFSGSGKNTKPASSKIGINLILEEVANIKPGINSCRQPISSFFKSEASSFEGCKSFILENLNKAKRLDPITKIKLDTNYDVYTTGSTWNYYYPNREEELTLEELNRTGKEFCSLTIDQILKKGIKKKNAYNLCYSRIFES